MIEYREITSADGDLVGALKIDGGVLTKFTYDEGSKYMPFELSAEDLAGVTSIGNRAFMDCTSLTSIIIPNSVTSIGYAAFAGCSSLTSVTIPESVTRIGQGVFDGCTRLTSIKIPNNVTSIGEVAFDSCDINTLTLRATSKALGLESVNIECETDRVMGFIRDTKAYGVQARAFELLIGSSKIAWEMSVSLDIIMSRSTRKSVYTYCICLIRQLSEWSKCENYHLHKAIWNSPVLARCLEAKIYISQKHSVNKINSTITAISNKREQFLLKL